MRGLLCPDREMSWKDGQGPISPPCESQKPTSNEGLHPCSAGSTPLHCGYLGYGWPPTLKRRIRPKRFLRASMRGQQILNLSRKDMTCGSFKTTGDSKGFFSVLNSTYCLVYLWESGSDIVSMTLGPTPWVVGSGTIPSDALELKHFKPIWGIEVKGKHS